MMITIHRILAIGAITALFTPLAAADLKESLEAAMASDIRTEAEVARDRNRKPVETLTFFGLKEDMRVLELLPGGGWYTKLLAPVLEEEGQLYVSIGTGTVEKMLEDGVISGVEVIEPAGEFKRSETTRRFYIDGLDIDVKNLDMVLTFRNLHNMTEQGVRRGGPHPASHAGRLQRGLAPHGSGAGDQRDRSSRIRVCGLFRPPLSP
jgi:predicted methyltransferase